MRSLYTPQQGDLVYLTFDPQAGHEQRGRRPALVISRKSFNEVTGFAMVCPITSTPRDYPLHVPLPEDGEITGFVMVEQIKSLDHQQRKARFVAKAPMSVLDDVLALLDACLYAPRK